MTDVVAESFFKSKKMKALGWRLDVIICNIYINSAVTVLGFKLMTKIEVSASLLTFCKHA